MREQRLTTLRNGVLTALGLLQACGGRIDDDLIREPDQTATAVKPGAAASPAGDDAPGAPCAPMAASDDTSGFECTQTPSYAWDGTHCVALRCGCIGTDCDTTFSSVMGCYGERGACDPLGAERAACIRQYPSQENIDTSRVSSECLTAAGTGCDAASFISEGAAVCIAQLEGLEEGLLPWTVGLFYDASLARVARSVTNTTELASYGDDGSTAGTNLELDATTGVLLETTTWLAIPGRPFLVDHTPRTAPATRRRDYAAPTPVRLDGIPPESRAALAAEWTRVGLLEHASVAAFARFALQLLGLGAPPALLDACQQAMQDETRHTRIAFGLASAYAQTPLGPGPLTLDGALDSPSGDLLAHVTMNTFLEGCIGETVAVLDAREGAAHAADPEVRQALSQIARDEERHAQLAWRFLDWALAQRPELALPLLARARAQLASKPSNTPDTTRASTEPALLEHGILPLAQKLQLETRALEHVILPCLVALAGKHATASSKPGSELASTITHETLST